MTARTLASKAGPPSGARSAADALIIRFLDDIQRLGPDEWLAIAGRFAGEQAAMAANRSPLAKLRHTVIMKRAAGADQQREVIGFNRWSHERMLAVVEALPETAPGADGKRFPLRAAAASAARAAEAVLRIFDAEIAPARAATLAAPALRPFQGFVTLPPLPAASASKSRVREPAQPSGSPAAYHLRFPDDYFTFAEPSPAGASVAPLDWNRRDTHHESWSWPVLPELACRFGGECDRPCAVCGGRLHHLISLPALSGQHFESVGPVEAATCLSCLGWSEPVLYFRHNAEGRSQATGYAGPRRKPESSASPLREAIVRLAATPPRWKRQKWEDADGQNLNRIGGSPSWVQDADVPRCCGCRKRMQFLMQVDSELPTVEAQRWRWGSGGVLYVFWCGACRIDAQLWQCS